jgi:hypothetical protein
VHPETIHEDDLQHVVTINGSLSNGGVGIAGKTIEVSYYNPETGSFIVLGTPITDGDGAYSFSWDLPNTLVDGFYPIKAVFGGDGAYLATQAETTNTPRRRSALRGPEFCLAP